MSGNIGGAPSHSPAQDASEFKDIFNLRLANTKLTILLEEQRRELDHLRKLLVAKGITPEELSPSFTPTEATGSIKRALFSNGPPLSQKRQKSVVPPYPEDDVQRTSNLTSEMDMTKFHISSSSHQESQQQQKGMLASLVNSLDEACVIFNANMSKVLYVTEVSHDRVFGSGTSAKILEHSANWTEWVHREDLKTLMRKTMELVETPMVSRMRWSFSYRITDPDGNIRRINTLARTIYRSSFVPPSDIDSLMGSSDIFHILFSHEVKNDSPKIPQYDFSPISGALHQYHGVLAQTLRPDTVVMILDHLGNCLEYLPSQGVWKNYVNPEHNSNRLGCHVSECLGLAPSTDQHRELTKALEQAAGTSQMQTVKLTIEWGAKDFAIPPAGSRLWYFEARISCIDGKRFVCMVNDETAFVAGQKSLFEMMAKERKTSLRMESCQLTQHRIQNVSHEFRTSLNGVLGMTTLLLHTELDEEQRDYLESIRSSAMRLIQAMSEIIETG